MEFNKHIEKYSNEISKINNSSKIKLYHYTDLDAFYSIIKNKKLWASNILCMNDPSEYYHSLRMLSDRDYECILKVIDNKEEFVSSQIKKKLERILNDFLKEYSIFVISFSSKEDCLDLWRGYSNNKDSLSICFSRKKLIKNFNECINNHDNIKSFLTNYVIERDNKVFSILNRCNYTDYSYDLRMIRKDIYNNNKTDNEEYLKSIARLFSLYAPFYKDKAYSSESEWRYVIYIPVGELMKYQKFRTGRKLLVSYIEKTFTEDSIENVLVAPGVENFNKEIIVEFLKTEIKKAVNVNNSKIPFIK